jgi:hypothetical protein
MRAHLLSLALLLPLAAAALPVASAQGTGSGYGVQFLCPPVVESDAAGAKPPTACPAYVLDTEDVMAQPRLVVDPREPRLVAFNALHGGSGVRTAAQDPLPTPHSRDNLVHQPHTTFVSGDAGAHWDDHRYPSPLATQHEAQPPLIPLFTPPSAGGNEVFGEDNAMVADRHGKLTIASLYSARDEKGGPVHYRVVAWDQGRIGDALDYDKGYTVLSPTDPDDAVDSLQAVDLPDAHETVLAWRETGPDGKGWLQMAHKAQDDGGAQWELLPREQRVGPCSHTSNPIEADGRVYVGCVAADGYTRGNVGQAQVHALTPGNWTTERVSAAPMQGLSSLTLASAEGLREGGMVLAGSGVREGRPIVLVAAGVRGGAWGRANDYAASLGDAAQHPGARLLESRVNALAVLAASGTVHMVYMERYTAQGTGGQQEFSKFYAAAKLDGRFLGRFAVGYGDPQSRATISPQVTGVTGDDYDDQHDSIVVTHDRTGKERAFVAFGDYGYVRFAEVQEQGPPLPVFPPLGAPAAIPTLAASTSPVLVGALAGTLSTAAVLRAALAKSKKAAEAPTL